MRALFLFMMYGLIAQSLVAQSSDTVEARKVFEFRGYLKDMQSVTYDQNFSNPVIGNLIHNRLNFRWNPTTRITGALELRTRFYWGEQVRLTPGFAKMLRNPNEAVDLSRLWVSGESMALQSNIDRLWFEYRANKWDARVGRQRLNWGIATIWNPNDIFNTYNFLDFDYEERPGRDAAKFIYHINNMSNLELSAAAADQTNKTVAAMKYFTNKWNYDFQFSGGIFHDKFTMGTGWSGSIKDAGFKGEVQYFTAHQDTAAQINVAAESDYVFAKGWYLNIGFLFNSAGISEPVNNWNLVAFRLSPEHLMPTKWNLAFTQSKQITPLFSGTLSVIYAPGANLMILLPSIKYNLASNFDVDLIWQSFFAEQYDNFGGVSHRGYLRFKWSF